MLWYKSPSVTSGYAKVLYQFNMWYEGHNNAILAWVHNEYIVFENIANIYKANEVCIHFYEINWINYEVIKYNMIARDFALHQWNDV